MILFKKATDLGKWLDAQQKKGNSIGFAPTMGALHVGHISLIEISKSQNQVSVCSIFVNPTQFNVPADFQKYPITLEKDILMLEEAGCDVLFLPSVVEMYPNGVNAKKNYELGYLETLLEGKFRPGHFQGVCMIVQHLLEIVQPDNLYLGQKDYQQCLIIKKLVELIKRDNKIKITICPTLRETDGLAMSSRNMQLNEKERKKGAIIHNSLKLLKDSLEKGDLTEIKKKATSMLEEAGFRIDYVEIADATTLSVVNEWDGKQKLVALVAAFVNEVRLIDNMLLN